MGNFPQSALQSTEPHHFPTINVKQIENDQRGTTPFGIAKEPKKNLKGGEQCLIGNFVVKPQYMLFYAYFRLSRSSN